MAKWLHLIVLIVLFGVSKGHHLIRIVILAALGLAGLWMVHTLAQDYQNITAGSHGGGSGGGGGKTISSEGTVEFSKLFSKRSITDVHSSYYHEVMMINFYNIINNILY